MKKRLYIVASIFLVTLLSFQTLKSSTQSSSQAVVVELDEDLTAIDFKSEDNFKDFDAYTD
ncbi:hypothetical protein QQ020_34145 [Fulvivirgaceae bacterium BMA12]|uniref:Uncharacterized protein n=1 Tax=Agaribacillus aureus TaxID=3051825 RepID=A0ABT8LH84_9BACT|nr:hypothetical protein [Fulvivirgaceae bacterium BMA12]